MRRGALCLGLVLLLAVAGPSSCALAAPDVTLRHASDGAAVVLGSGWRPGQQLVVSLGQDRFTAYVDSGGGFEVTTSVIGYKGAVGIHRPDPQVMTFATLGLSESPPLAVLFAQSLAYGMALLALSVSAILAGWIAARPLRKRR